MDPADGAELPLVRLSERERQVIDLARQGMTDELISHQLGVSFSTVKTYWTRIRDKVGPLTRTEIVSRMVRADVLDECRRIRADHQRLRVDYLKYQAQYQEITATLDELLKTSQTLRSEARLIRALWHLPQATLVTEPSARIVFANHEAYQFYGAGPGELEGLFIRELTTRSTPQASREPSLRLFEPDGPDRETIGLTEPYYVLRRDGTSTRGVVRAARYNVGAQRYAVLTVNGYGKDPDWTDGNQMPLKLV